MKKHIHLPLQTVSAFLFIMSLCTAARGATSFDDDVKIISGPARRDQQSAVARLQSGGADAVSAIVRGLTGSTPETKKELLGFLKVIRSSRRRLKAKDEDSRELARLAREETDRSLRYDMVDGLASLGGPAALTELKRIAADDPEEVIRNDATRAIDLHNDPDLVFFGAQMKDKSRLVRLTAALALAERADNSGRALALETLKSTTGRDERRKAIALLGEVGNPEDIPLLQQLASASKEEYVSQNLATKSLKSIALKQLPESARLDFLMSSLDDPDVLVRDWALYKLWRSKDPATDHRLKDYLKEPGHRGYKEAAHALDVR